MVVAATAATAMAGKRIVKTAENTESGIDKAIGRTAEQVVAATAGVSAATVADTADLVVITAAAVVSDVVVITTAAVVTDLVVMTAVVVAVVMISVVSVAREHSFCLPFLECSETPFGVLGTAYAVHAVSLPRISQKKSNYRLLFRKTML